MPILDPEQEGQPLLRDPLSFLKLYGVPFRQPESELIQIGGQTYVSDQALALIEDLVIEFDGFWGGTEPSVELSLAAIEKENAWCVETFGHIPRAQVFETRTWAFFKRGLNRSRDTLYQKICVEMRYCARKGTINRLSLLVSIAKLIHKAAIEELELLPVPIPDEALEIFHIAMYLMSVFLVLSKFINKLCGCK